MSLTQASSDDGEELVALRIDAMRESLESIGRFEPARARERFLSSFEPSRTRHIELGGIRVGFFVLKPIEGALLLDHLYVRPQFQSRGIGAAVLHVVFGEAAEQALAVKVGALRGSRSNQFYKKNGFTQVEQTEFDNYYLHGGALRC
ncbi:GNAT family N-acetyltransferase [Polaromonas sp.]|uniref:GNAT family N-acetyltransferase n=1 Tax=Polaromonas sp. TaxID=1869339 RepID=UPI00326744CD